MNTHTFHVQVTWNSDRKGLICSPEVNEQTLNSHSCLEVATPPQFPKGMAGIWSPEHLYTAAVGSCLMTTFLAIAENSRLDFLSFSCDTEGVMEQVDGKWLMTHVHLTPTVEVKTVPDLDRAHKVLMKSEANCLISNSIKAKVTMQPKVLIAVPS